MIRPATARDSNTLTAISFASKHYWQYPEEYFEIWRNELTISPEYIEKNVVFIYEWCTAIIGYYALVILETDRVTAGITMEKGAWLEHLFVAPAHIGEGVGSRLFDHLRQRCTVSGIRKVGILADPNSRGFYEKMGCTYIRDYPSTIKGRTTPYLRYDADSITGA